MQLPHTTTVVQNSTGRLDLFRKNGEHDSYSVSCTYGGVPGLVAIQTSPHSFVIQRLESPHFEEMLEADQRVTVEIVCRYQLGCCVGTSPPVDEKDLTTKQVPTVDAVLRHSLSAWKDFWESGAFVDIAGATEDPQAFELERRTIQSLYLMRSQEAGTVPPQESGLLYNSWTGKHHSEMRYWYLLFSDLLRDQTEIQLNILVVFNQAPDLDASVVAA